MCLIGVHYKFIFTGNIILTLLHPLDNGMHILRLMVVNHMTKESRTLNYNHELLTWTANCNRMLTYVMQALKM